MSVSFFQNVHILVSSKKFRFNLSVFFLFRRESSATLYLINIFCGCCLSGGCSFFLLHDSHKFYCLDLVKSKKIFREIYIKSLLNVFFKPQMVWICFGYTNFLFIFFGYFNIYHTFIVVANKKKIKTEKWYH